MIHVTATVVRNGAAREIPLRDLVPGDIVKLAAGDMIPGDVRLLSLKDLFPLLARFSTTRLSLSCSGSSIAGIPHTRRYFRPAGSSSR
jgi:hypothetical protein